MTSSSAASPAVGTAVSTAVRLREHGTGEVVTLSPHQAEAIKAVDLVKAQRLRGGRYRLSPSERVGMLRVYDETGSASIDVVVEPKLPISRLVYLLGYSTGIVWREELLDVPEDEDLLPAVARVLASLGERALARGVLQGYRTVTGALPVVRGRLLIAEQARRRAGLALPVECRFDEWTVDVPENQILLAGVRLARVLPGVEEDVAQRLRRIEVQLEGVYRLPVGAPLPRWHGSRLNARYQPALRVAELVCRHASVAALPEGPFSFFGFVVWMREVFESFVMKALGAALARHGGSVTTQRTTSLDTAGLLKIRPDLEWHQAGRVRAVVDAKYKAADRVRNPDAYQMITYCLRHGVPLGHLVYAASQEPERTYEIVGTHISVVQHALDLTVPTIGGLHARVQEIARNIACPEHN